MNTSLNILLSVIFVIRFGYIGVIYGTFIAMVVGATYLKVRFHRITGFSFAEMGRTVLIKPILGCLAATAAALFTRPLISAWNGWITLIAQGILFVAVYISILRASRHFDGFDKEIFQSYLPGKVIGLLAG